MNNNSLMHRYRSIFLMTPVGLLFLAACSLKASAQATTPVDVALTRTADDGWILSRGGKPYFIKGAGGSASKSLLKSCGGNSFRTWGSDTLGSDLDEAQRNGLTVAAGIWLGHKDQGFDYGNTNQVAQQRTMVHDVVTQYHDNPALLIWSLGNEMEGDGSDVAIWKEIEYLAKMVKQLDPHHPVMTVICEPIDKKIKEINDNCPDVDIIGINAYASAPSIGVRYIAGGGSKPYVLTEFGPPGQWEQPNTTWGASIELTSTAKAQWYRNAYAKSVLGQKLCIGSYAFLWGNKQEATVTWYGMVLPTGEKLEAADAMTALWNSVPFVQTAPVIKDLKIDGPDTVPAGSNIHVSLDAASPSQTALQYNWLVRNDRKAVANGGEAEANLGTIADAVRWTSSDGADITAPSTPGGYRIFVYLRSKPGDAAVANVPFLVQPADNTAGAQAANAGAADVPKAQLPYSIYGENGKASVVFIPSGYMGNAAAITMDPSSKDVPGRAGGSTLKVSYTASDNWGGVVWQSPVNDWGDAAGGLNFTGAKKLIFWARGADGGESVSFQFGLIGPDKRYHDSSSGKADRINLTTQWTEYSIDLTGKDLSDIKTAFVWTAAANGKPITFYLDDIRYE